MQDSRGPGPSGPEEGPAIGPFIGEIGECSALLELLRERLNDHLGVSPDDVGWGHVADAARLHGLLRQAAAAAGIGGEPV